MAIALVLEVLERMLRISSQEVLDLVQDLHLELVQGLGSEISQITISTKVRKCVCMYVCMHVCKCVFIRVYVCIYVCIHVCMCVCCMYVCMYVCLYSCTYVRIKSFASAAGIFFFLNLITF